MITRKPRRFTPLEIRKQTSGELHADYATALSNLAVLYLNMGRPSRAEPLLRHALAIRKQIFGEKHVDYAAALNNLAVACKETGDYARAAPLIEQALAIRKQLLGELHPQYASSLNNLADLYDSMGDYARAEPLYQQALAIRRQVFGDKHPEYAASLNNLAELCESMRDYARAEPLFEQALAIRKQVLGDKHPEYAASLSNLALLYKEMGKYDKAEPLYQQAIETCRRALGENHPRCATSLSNLAFLYQARGNNAGAEPLFRQAADVYKRALGEMHPQYAASLNNLAVLYEDMGDDARAEPLLRQSLGITMQALRLAAAEQSERQQLAMAVDVRFELDSYLALCIKHKRDAAELYRFWLAWKGHVWLRQQQLHALAGHAELKPRFDQLQHVTGRLAQLALATPATAQADAARGEIVELSQEKERLERALAAASAALGSTLKDPQPAELQHALPDDAVLVDFAEYSVRPAGGQPPEAKRAWQRRLAAFVVKRHGKIELFDLGPSAAVDRAIDQWRGPGEADLGRSPAAREAGQLLRARLWQPIEQRLAGTTLVLVSPEGALGKLPFTALPGNQPDTYLVEDHALVVVAAPAVLVEKREHTAEHPEGNLLVVADVDYDQTATPTSNQAASQLAYRGPPGDGSETWPRLAGTREELIALAQLYHATFGQQGLTALQAAQATEHAVRQLAPQFRYLHLATHGFFAPQRFRSALEQDLGDREQSREKLVTGQTVVGYHPGLLSGLVLAGANRPHSSDDGYLTAEEVATLDLRGVELCVLSACETGLGQVAGGEGLLGLQRAFQAAGAQAVLASLWRVPDRATEMLMTRFYANLWQKKMSKLTALRQAQLWMLRQVPKDQKLLADASRGVSIDWQLPASDAATLPPGYWAAFVLSGDWH